MRPAFIVIAVLLIAMVPCISWDSEGAKSFVSPDGIEYGYETFGSQHSDYRALIVSATSSSETVVLASALEGHEVRDIGAGAFDFPHARLILVPSSVRTIGTGAFDSCPMLEEVLFMGDRPGIGGGLPDGVSERMLSDNQFSEASADGSTIRYVEISGEAMAIGGSPSSDGSLTIPSEVRGLKVASIGGNAFAGRDSEDGSEVVPRTDIGKVTISDGVETIRERAFYYCSGIGTVRMPETIRTIMDEAFRASYGLKDATIPGSVEYLGFEAFRHCTSLIRISVPDSVRFIGEGAFKVCSSAESISVGSGTEIIGDWAFSYCQSATTLEMKHGAVRIGASAFYDCGSLGKVVLPDSVETIGNDAFYNCSSLKGIDLGSNLKTVGSGAFRGCSALGTMEFPDTLERMGDKALAYCSGLKDVYFLGDMPEFGSAVFLNVDAKVHCTEEHAGSWEGFDGVVVDRSGGFPIIIATIIIAVILIATAAIVLARRRTRRYRSQESEGNCGHHRFGPVGVLGPRHEKDVAVGHGGLPADLGRQEGIVQIGPPVGEHYQLAFAHDPCGASAPAGGEGGVALIDPVGEPVPGARDDGPDGFPAH